MSGEVTLDLFGFCNVANLIDQMIIRIMILGPYLGSHHCFRFHAHGQGVEGRYFEDLIF